MQANMSWEGCGWYSSVDHVPKGKKSDYCVSSCPGNMVRLSMSTMGDCLKPGGWQAFCCNEKYYVSEEKRNPEMQLWKDRLDNYLDNGMCPADLDVVAGPSTTLAERDKSTDNFSWLAYVLVNLLDATPYTAKEQIEADQWDTLVQGHGLDNLVMGVLKPFVLENGLLLRGKAIDLAKDILCRLSFWNSRIKSDKPTPCAGDVCADDVDPTLCEVDQEDGEDPDTEDSNITRRRLVKRDDPKKFKVWCRSTAKWEEGLRINALYYPPQGKWRSDSTQFENARTWEDPDDCGNPKVISQTKTSDDYNTEHILELQLIPLFFQHLTAGTLMSGKPAQFQAVDCSLFLDRTRDPQNGKDLLNASIMGRYKYQYPKRKRSLQALPATWIMEAVGTALNNENFYLLQQEINGMKKRVFSNHSLVNSVDMARFVADTTDASKALKEIKTAIGVWSYLNDEEVQESFSAIFSNVKAAFSSIDAECVARYATMYQLPEAWDEWFIDMLEYQVGRSYNWIESNIKAMRDVWAPRLPDPTAIETMGHLSRLEQGLQTYVKAQVSGEGDKGISFRRN
ncbi:hypothetical protein ATERTT37_003764 [Aspergillus terreus]